MISPKSRKPTLSTAKTSIFSTGRTTNTDEVSFNRAKETHPYAYIAKPIKNIDLQRAIELTISRMANEHHQYPEPQPFHPVTSSATTC